MTRKLIFNPLCPGWGILEAMFSVDGTSGQQERGAQTAVPPLSPVAWPLCHSPARGGKRQAGKAATQPACAREGSLARERFQLTEPAHQPFSLSASSPARLPVSPRGVHPGPMAGENGPREKAGLCPRCSQNLSADLYCGEQ